MTSRPGVPRRTSDDGVPTMVALAPWHVVVAAYAGTPGTTPATAEATAIANAIGPTRVMREVGRTLTM